jgi:hypothetical protein
MEMEFLVMEIGSYSDGNGIFSDGNEVNILKNVEEK